MPIHVRAAADEAELVHMVATQVAIDDRPSALRYPRGDGVGVDMPEFGVPLPTGVQNSQPDWVDPQNA